MESHASANLLTHGSQITCSPSPRVTRCQHRRPPAVRCRAEDDGTTCLRQGLPGHLARTGPQDRRLDVTEERLTMRRQSQNSPATIARRRRPEDGTDLDEEVDDPGRRRRRNHQGVNHIRHRAARAGLDVCERAPAIHGEIGARQRVLDARGRQGCLSEQRERVRDNFHGLPSETTPSPCSHRSSEEHQHAR
jgi:hypothetical protein